LISLFLFFRFLYCTQKHTHYLLLTHTYIHTYSLSIHTYHTHIGTKENSQEQMKQRRVQLKHFVQQIGSLHNLLRVLWEHLDGTCTYSLSLYLSIYLTNSKTKLRLQRRMAPEMMKGKVKFGPSVDIYSFGVVMWECWAQQRPWSEMSDKQNIFKAVRDEKMKLKSPSSNKPEGYDNLMKRCYDYEFRRRPLIDAVRCELQNLTEAAAELDRLRLKVETPRSMSARNVLNMSMSSGNSSGIHSSDDDYNANKKVGGGVHIEMGALS